MNAYIAQLQYTLYQIYNQSSENFVQLHIINCRALFQYFFKKFTPSIQWFLWCNTFDAVVYKGLGIFAFTTQLYLTVRYDLQDATKDEHP